MRILTAILLASAELKRSATHNTKDRITFIGQLEGLMVEARDQAAKQTELRTAQGSC